MDWSQNQKIHKRDKIIKRTILGYLPQRHANVYFHSCMILCDCINCFSKIKISILLPKSMLFGSRLNKRLYNNGNVTFYWDLKICWKWTWPFSNFFFLSKAPAKKPVHSLPVYVWERVLFLWNNTSRYYISSGKIKCMPISVMAALGTTRRTLTLSFRGCGWLQHAILMLWYKVKEFSTVLGRLTKTILCQK